MTARDTANAIAKEERLPTLEEAAAAALILLYCNGMDLSEWTDGNMPDDFDTSLKAIVQHSERK